MHDAVDPRYFRIRGDRAAGVYRESEGRTWLYKDGRWIAIVPSEQDYNSFMPITRDEARKRLPARAFTDHLPRRAEQG